MTRDAERGIAEIGPPLRANRWAAALRDAGADVVMSERVASHGAALWRGEFPLMVAWTTKAQVSRNAWPTRRLLRPKAPLEDRASVA